MKKLLIFLSFFIFILLSSYSIYCQKKIVVSFEQDCSEKDSFKSDRFTEFYLIPFDYYKKSEIRLFVYKILIEIEAPYKDDYDDFSKEIYNKSQCYTLAIVPGDIIPRSNFMLPLLHDQRKTPRLNKTNHPDVIILDNKDNLEKYYDLLRANNFIVRLYDMRE